MGPLRPGPAGPAGLRLHRPGGEILPLPDRRRAAVPVVLLALAGALWLFPDAYTLEKVMDQTALAGNLAAGFLLPALLLLVKKLRRLP